MYKKILFFILIMFLFITFPIKVNASHQHTQDCYSGILHKHSGNEHELGSCYSIPIYHVHEITCYSNQCSKDIAEYNFEQTSVGNCKKCNSVLYKYESACKLCGVGIDKIFCSNINCDNYINILEEQNKLVHKSLNYDNTINYGTLICGKDESTILQYAKTCIYEENVYYNEDGSKATPCCDKIATKWVALNEKPNGKNISNKIKITYLDGHVSIIEASHSNINEIDYNKNYVDYPITLYFSVQTSSIGTEQEQSVVVYYTNIVEEVESEISTINENVMVENNNSTSENTKESNNESFLDIENIKKEDNKEIITKLEIDGIDNNINEDTSLTLDDFTKLEIEENKEIIENNKNIEIEKTNENNTIVIFIIITIFLILLGGGIYYFVYMKNKKEK